MIPPTRLDDDDARALVARMRNPDERRGDLRAQLAAHTPRRAADRGALRATRTRAASRRRWTSCSRTRSASCAQRSRELPDGRFEGADALETPDGLLEIRAAVTIAGDAIEIDFDGTAPQHAGNLNCPLAVTRSACFYVVRCLTAPDLPASGGAFAPVTVRAPEGCLVNARPPAAVAAGNTETSSRIVDVVFAALSHALPGPRAGPGDDEQRRPRQRALHVLRDDRRRAGRVPGRATARPPCTSRCRTRSTRPSRRSSSRTRSASSATSCARLGRRRALPRRRRRRPRAPRARALPALAAHAAPRARAARRRRRRGRAARAATS